MFNIHGTVKLFPSLLRIRIPGYKEIDCKLIFFLDQVGGLWLLCWYIFSFTKLWFNVINWKLIVWASGQNLKSLSWLSLQNNFRGSAECCEKGNISVRFIWSSFLYTFIFKQSGTVFRYDCTNIANISPFRYNPPLTVTLSHPSLPTLPTQTLKGSVDIKSQAILNT